MSLLTPERQRDVLAVHLLEEIGTPEARQTLAKLSKGAPGVELTTAAQAVLDHLTALGHSLIANIAGPQKLSTGKGRLDAFRRHRRDIRRPRQ